MALATDKLVEDLIGPLPALPDSVVRMLSLINRTDADAGEIALLIGQDPVLARRVLTVANSPGFAMGTQPIDSVARAILLLGTRQLRDLILIVAVANVLNGLFDDRRSGDEFWQHSLYCGLVAQALAGGASRINAETMFTTGLLHDIGRPLLWQRLPAQSRTAMLQQMQADPGCGPYHAENTVVGVTHCEVGASLARRWQLPALMTECIACHHQPAQAVEFTDAVAQIHIANAIAALPHDEFPLATDRLDVAASVWEQARVTPAEITSAVEFAQAEMPAMHQLLFG